MKDWDNLYDHVMTMLKEKLSPMLNYHHWKHTVYVVEMAEFIARKEHCSDEDILLVKTAALLHDAGFISSHGKGHEAESILLAQKILPNYGYRHEEISQIADMIRATEIPQNPQNELESILADADMEYLGTDNFTYIADKLYQELRHNNPNLTRDEWDDIQIEFLQSHVYHTPYCLHNRAAVKARNLQVLLDRKENR